MAEHRALEKEKKCRVKLVKGMKGVTWGWEHRQEIDGAKPYRSRSLVLSSVQ